MQPGKKPLPTNIKLLKGTARKCRLNPGEIQPDVIAPDPPDHLSEYARREWSRITVELLRLGLLSEIDRAALAAYCQCYGRWVDAEEKLNKTGLVRKTTNGNIVQNPLIGIANRAMEIMRQYLVEFGMTPSARTRVTPVGKDTAKKTNKWAM